MSSPQIPVTETDDIPFFSIVLPTYRRPRLLQRAVSSVLEQDFASWELIIRDNEPDNEANHQYMATIDDPRVRYECGPNLGHHGNVNWVVGQAHGRWIKPLWDDDVLHPGCLRRFAAAIRALQSAQGPDVTLIRCLATRYENGKRVAEPPDRRHPLEVIARHDVHYSMYLQDVDLGTPSQVAIRRDCILDGDITYGEMDHAVDTWWFAQVLRHGDLALLNERLVDIHQGHSTITSSATEEVIDKDMARLREKLLGIIEGGAVPDVDVSKQSLWFMRAISRLRRKQIGEAIRLWARVRHLSGWVYGARWLLRRLFPGRFHIVPREPVRFRPHGPDPHRVQTADRR